MNHIQSFGSIYGTSRDLKGRFVELLLPYLTWRRTGTYTQGTFPTFGRHKEIVRITYRIRDL
jgi:hypothetical protein